MRTQLILLILPGIALFLAILLKSYSGPYYLGSNNDPSYAYLLNGANLWQGKAPGHVDHPGSTVHEITALSVGITYLLGGQNESLQRDILANPEKYLQVISYVLIGLVLLTVYYLSWRVTCAFKSLWYGVFFQLALFTQPMIIYEMTFVKPEALLIMATLVYMYIVFKMLMNNDFEDRYHIYCRDLGIICGFGLISKLTFLPLLVASCFLLAKTYYQQGFLSIYLKGLLRFFAFFVSAALILGFPALFSYQYLAHWVIGLVIGSGKYGSGELIIIAPSLFITGLKEIFLQNLWLVFSYIIALVMFIYSYVQPQKLQAQTVSILRFIFITFSLQILMVAKHYGNHYLLPILPWTLMVLFIVKKCLPNFKLPKLLAYSGLLCFIVLYIINLRSLTEFLLDKKQAQINVLAKVKAYSNKKIIGYRRASGIEHSLMFGIFWTRKTQANNAKSYERDYDELYNPGMVPWHKVSLASLKKDKENIIIQTQVKLPKLLLEKRENGRIYQIELKKEFTTRWEHLYSISQIK